nr:hypothetical protein [Bradyrhizobium diazoefficiens]
MAGVKQARDGAVGILTLDEPASLNAMTPDLLGALAAAVAETTDRNLKVSETLGEDIAAGVMRLYWPAFRRRARRGLQRGEAATRFLAVIAGPVPAVHVRCHRCQRRGCPGQAPGTTSGETIRESDQVAASERAVQPAGLILGAPFGARPAHVVQLGAVGVARDPHQRLQFDGEEAQGLPEQTQ